MPRPRDRDDELAQAYQDRLAEEAWDRHLDERDERMAFADDFVPYPEELEHEPRGSF